MRYAVIDADYSDTRYIGLGASWLRWYLRRLGAEIVEPDAAEVLLVSTTSQQRAGSVRHRIRRYPGRPVVVGGMGSYGAAAFDGIASVVCVGEGARFVRTMVREGLDAAARLPEAWVPGETREVVPSADFPWDVPPILHPDGKYRVFESRGCKHRCLFCQTGWERRHIVNPDLGRLVATCRELYRRGLPYDLVTNDAGVTGVIQQVPGGTMASYGYRHLTEMSLAWLPRTVRIGVEGVSERLRRAAGKPIPTSGLVDLVRRLLAAHHLVRLFFVAGLPREADEDWVELLDLVRGIGCADRGLVHLGFHAFIPQPAAPLAVLPLADEYFEREEEACGRFFDRDSYSRRIHWGKPAGYRTRLKLARLSMAATEDELRRGWQDADPPNWRITYMGSPGMLRRLAAGYVRRLGGA
jgi:radical SAM superfamily enzyme YgiQ (UPF0313 family)